jgi:hypothetical protein
MNPLKTHYWMNNCPAQHTTMPAVASLRHGTLWFAYWPASVCMCCVVLCVCVSVCSTPRSNKQPQVCSHFTCIGPREIPTANAIQVDIWVRPGICQLKLYSYIFNQLLSTDLAILPGHQRAFQARERSAIVRGGSWLCSQRYSTQNKVGGGQSRGPCPK